ncbi:hypothetical protein DFJ74DRAFT_690733 [Hyaloraphidium curvatum]|nr:hypothetical protein DFJ74DRAFT_690733 [Hyaloraphidium curvatum]
MGAALRLSIVVLLAAVCIAMRGAAAAPSPSPDCAWVEALLRASGTVVPWTTGVCCDWGNAGRISCNSNGRITWLAPPPLERPTAFPAISSLTDVEVIWLEGQQLTGPIPDLSALVALKELHLARNDLSGGFPDLSKNTYLQIVELRLNPRLGGPLPASLTGLTSLGAIDISNCSFTGPLPAFARSMQGIFVDGNRITGSIPDFRVSYPNIVSFMAVDNLMTGTIPYLSGLRNLKWFMISGNPVEGAIPDLSDLPALWYFHSARTSLSGPIPTLPRVGGLWILQLNGNPGITGGLEPLATQRALFDVNLAGTSVAGRLDGVLNLGKIFTCEMPATVTYCNASAVPPACREHGAVLEPGCGTTSTGRPTTRAGVPTTAKTTAPARRPTTSKRRATSAKRRTTSRKRSSTRKRTTSRKRTTTKRRT